jgi:hypothetical protein
LEHEDDLVKLHSRNGNILSFRHYPPVDVAKAEELGIPRMAAHRDFSPSITMLFQDQCGGLEILKPGSEGEFIHVTPIEGTFVMNIGDVLMRWSNGMLRNAFTYYLYFLLLSLISPPNITNSLSQILPMLAAIFCLYILTCFERLFAFHDASCGLTSMSRREGYDTTSVFYPIFRPPQTRYCHSMFPVVFR